MEIQIDILRRENADAPPYMQSFLYEPEGRSDTVATALDALNRRPVLRDRHGNPAPPIQWECGCFQRKCGACAMVINGRPGLACDARLSAFRTGFVWLEPLRKFPAVADLIVDRSIMWDNLRAARSWLEDPAAGYGGSDAYEASRCLQCGCCLEVCPNFAPGEAFFGMAAAVPLSRLLREAAEPDRRDLSRSYRTHVYAGCGKSLSCAGICPAGIPIEGLLLHSNALAVWRRGTLDRRREKG